jgi:hypothetical protein
MSVTNALGATPEALVFVEGLHAPIRMAKPEEIMRLMLDLASTASSFITGAALLVDGGVSFTRLITTANAKGLWSPAVRSAADDVLQLQFIELAEYKETAYVPWSRLP